MATRRWTGKAAIAGALALLALSWAGPLAAQRGAMTAPRNLAQLVETAGVILDGRIVSAQIERDPQYQALWTVVVTLRVDGVLKGKAGNTYTFRQFLWNPRGGAAGAGYFKGSEVLLLLLKPNAHGLSSPVGLEQGRFHVVTDAQGHRYAINGRNNAGLFRGVAAAARSKGVRLTPRAATLLGVPSRGPIAFDDLRDLIRQLAGAN